MKLIKIAATAAPAILLLAVATTTAIAGEDRGTVYDRGAGQQGNWVKVTSNLDSQIHTYCIPHSGSAVDADVANMIPPVGHSVGVTYSDGPKIPCQGGVPAIQAINETNSN